MADRFFAEPERSIDGWGRVADAQRRITRAIEHVITHSPGAGNVVVVSHGAVGTLLLCALRGIPITRAEDQPSQGHCLAFEFGPSGRRLIHGWRRFG